MNRRFLHSQSLSDQSVEISIAPTYEMSHSARGQEVAHHKMTH